MARRKDVLVARPSQYTEQFRKDAVALVLSSDSPLRQVARDLGVNHETLRGWVRAAERETARRPAGSELSLSERDELRKLRARVRELELEKDILRKAAQYFAKEMGQ
jgi:transposase